MLYLRVMTTRLAICASLISALLIFILAASAHATEEYARKTGWECAACHKNPLGGGELTRRGELFMSTLAAEGKFRPLSFPKRVARLIIGYLHILAGVVWFGAIFYVHILLKPAYASKGLPKGELVLGWTGIGVVGVTGALLTYSRMPSVEAFYTTRFGVLLSIKIFFFLIMAGSAALVTFVLGPRMKKRMTAIRKPDGDHAADELKTFDGKEGRRALVAYEGSIYDVTESRLWKDGRHTRHQAGNDLTQALKGAPHGPDKLEIFPKTGNLLASSEVRDKDMPKAIFYFFAYMNLAMVFLVLGIVALWRWW
jgi:predicted heme/steroid binding protein